MKSAHVKSAQRETMCYEEQFSDPHAAVDGVRVHFRQRAALHGMGEALCRLQLAVHEWMANLAQHASFGERVPEVHVRLWQEDGHFRCTIEDNSNGFDLATQLEQQPDLRRYARKMPESGMGLLLLKASAERVEYVPVDERRNRLRLAVSAGASATGGGMFHEA